jgi:hypothetical protein
MLMVLNHPKPLYKGFLNILKLIRRRNANENGCVFPACLFSSALGTE